MVTAERKGGKHGGKEAMREDRMGGGKKKYASTLKKPHGKMYVFPFSRQYSNYITHSNSFNSHNHPRVGWCYFHFTDRKTEALRE